MKFFRPIFILSFVLLFLLIPQLNFAQTPPAVPCTLANNEYCPLSNLDGTGLTNSSGRVRVDLVTLLPVVIKFAIAISGALAVIMIMVGGIKYLTSEAFTGKSNAKETIQNAIWGLVLVIGSYTILNTLNPQLVKLNFNITPLQIGAGFGNNLGSTTPVETPEHGTVNTTPGISYGKAWGDDEPVRRALRAKGISFNNGDKQCEKIGQPSCTSVYGLNPKIVRGLIYLAENCKCQPMVTGGTEYWLHGNANTEIDKNPTDHKPGTGIAVDLSLNTGGVAEFLRKNGKPSTRDACHSTGTERYIYGGGIYVNETSSGQRTAAHWHVCFI